MSPPPSGEQVELRFGEQRAVVVEVGGGLREYAVAGECVLDGYAEHERCRGGRGQILAPWPNRLQDGSYEWEGETQQLALSEPPRANAIHGLVRWVNWEIAERSAAAVTMTHLLHPQDGYPFSLRLRVLYTLGEEGLSVQTSATNLGPSACPYGIGAHPYITVGGCVDDCLLQAPGAVRLQTDERAIPTGEVAVAGTDYDFRAAKAIGALGLDTCFGELERDSDGCARVVLQAPGDRGRSVTVWMDEAHPFLMLFTGDTLADVERRRRSLAIEPMSCAPNAFRTGAGVRRLEPGESFTSCWGIQPGPGPAVL